MEIDERMEQLDNEYAKGYADAVKDMMEALKELDEVMEVEE